MNKVRCHCGRFMRKYVTDDSITSPYETLDRYECENPKHSRFVRLISK